MAFCEDDFHVGMIAYFTVNQFLRDKRIRVSDGVSRDNKPRPFVCFAEADVLHDGGERRRAEGGVLAEAREQATNYAFDNERGRAENAGPHWIVHQAPGKAPSKGQR
jgi:hypothetical protein